MGALQYSCAGLAYTPDINAAIRDFDIDRYRTGISNKYETVLVPPMNTSLLASQPDRLYH